MTLKELEIGKSAVIKTVGGAGALRQHFGRSDGVTDPWL